MRGPPLGIVGAFVFAPASALMHTGCATQQLTWMPATTTVTPLSTRSSQWWYVGGALLHILAITLKEVG